MLKILGVIGGLTVLVTFAFTINQIPASAVGESTVFASFSGPNATGLVRVENFGSPDGSQVVARISRPTSGVVGFCLTRTDGSRACGTVNPSDSGFDKSTKGCAKFTISFSEIPTRVEIFDANFIISFAAADLTPTTPPNVGYLNLC